LKDLLIFRQALTPKSQPKYMPQHMVLRATPGICSLPWKPGMIDISPVHLETVKRILAEHARECEIRAFGSRVTWTAKDYSDLDLAVVGAARLDSDRFRLLREAFEESDLPFRVDILDWHTTSEKFKSVIEKKFEVLQTGRRDSL
jgi:type I restriction enzyme S subunit